MGTAQSRDDAAARRAAAHRAARSLQTVDWDVLSNAQLACALRLVLHEATRSTFSVVNGPAIIVAFLESYRYDTVPFLRLKCRPQEHKTQTQECAALLTRWPRPQLLELVDFLGLRGNLQPPQQLRLLSLMKKMVARLVTRMGGHGDGDQEAARSDDGGAAAPDGSADDALAMSGVYLARRVAPLGQGSHVAALVGDADARAHPQFVRAADAADLPRLQQVLGALRADMGLPAAAAATHAEEAREQLFALVWLLVPSREELAAWWRALPTPLQLLVRAELYLDGLVPQPIREDDSYILLKALIKFYVGIHIWLMYELAAALVRGVQGTTLRAVRAAVRGWRWLRTLTVADVRRGAAAGAARVRAVLPGTTLWVEHAGVREIQRAARIVGLDAGAAGARAMAQASHGIAAVCAEYMATLSMTLVDRERLQGHVDRAVQSGQVTPELEAALARRPDLLRTVRGHARRLRAALAEQRAALTRRLATAGRDLMRSDVAAVTWFGGLLYRLYFIGQYLGASVADMGKWLTRPDALPASVDALHAAAALVHGVPVARARSTLVANAEENERTAGAFGADLLALCVAFMALLRTTARGAAAAVPVLVQLWTDTVRDCRYGRHRNGAVRTRPRPRTVQDTLRAVRELARQRAAARQAASGDAAQAATGSNPFVFGVGGTARHPFRLPAATLARMRASMGAAAASFADWAASFGEFGFDDPFAAAFSDDDDDGGGDARPGGAGDEGASDGSPPPAAAAQQQAAPSLADDNGARSEKKKKKAKAGDDDGGRADRWRAFGDRVFAQAERCVAKLQALLVLVRDDADSPRLRPREQAKWRHLASHGPTFVDNIVTQARMMRHFAQAFAIQRRSRAEGGIILQGTLDKLRYEATLVFRTVTTLARRLPSRPSPSAAAAVAGGDLGNLQRWQAMTTAMGRVTRQMDRLQKLATAGRDMVVDEVAGDASGWPREKQAQVFAKWQEQGSTPTLQAVQEAEWEVFDDEPWAAPVPYRARVRILRAKHGHWREFPNRLLMPTFVAALIRVDDGDDDGGDSGARQAAARAACHRAAGGMPRAADASLFRVGTGDTASDIQIERARVRQMLATCTEKVCRTTPVLTNMAAFTAFWNGLDDGAREAAANLDRKTCVAHGKFCEPDTLVATQQKRVESIIGRAEADMGKWLQEHGADHRKPSITMCLLGVRGDRRQSIARKALRQYHPDRARTHVDKLVRGQVMRLLTDALVTAKTTECPSDAAAAEGTAKLAEVIARAKAVATEYEDIRAHVRAAEAEASAAPS